MYCDKCGADNSDTAKYCRKCGQPMEEIEESTHVRQRRAEVPPLHRDIGAGYAPPAAPVMPVAKKPIVATPQAQNDDRNGEADIATASPTLLFVKIGYVLAAIGALLLVAMTSAYFYQFFSITLSVIVGLLLFLIPAYYHFRQKLVRYRLTETKIEIDTGLIARATRNIPIRRIQDVTVASGVTQRLLGFGNVEIDNASEEGGKVVLRNIDDPRRFADLLLKQMSLLDK